MANKTIDHLDFMVDVTPYDHEGNKYDALYVGVSYSKGYGFYVSWQPVERTQYGYKTGPLPSSDKLVGGVRFLVEQAKKNSAKRIAEMHAALQLASEGIALYFDKRLFEQLNNFMRYVALYGYTPHYQQEVERLKEATEVSPVMRQYNDLKKKHPDALLLFRCGDFYEAYEQDANDVVKILGAALSKSRAAGNAYDMVGFPHYALDAYLPKLVRAGKRVAICDPINDNNNKAAIKREESDACIDSAEREQAQTKFNNNSEDKTMKTNETIENKNVQSAQVNNTITTEADVAEVNDIMPKVTPKAKTHPQPLPVSEGSEKSSGQTRTMAAKSGALPVLTFTIYKSAEGNEVPQIVGFGGEDDPRWKTHYDEGQRLKAATAEAKKKNEKLKAKMKGKSKEERAELRKQWVHTTSDPFGARCFTDRLTGEKKYYFSMGTKYADVARELCDAYNSGDAQAIAKAEQAVRDRRASINADYEAQREERKAAKNQPSAVSPQPSTEKTYTLDEVAQKLAKLLPGEANLDDIKELLKAA